VLFLTILLPVLSRGAKQENDEDDEDTTVFPKVLYEKDLCIFFVFLILYRKVSKNGHQTHHLHQCLYDEDDEVKLETSDPADEIT
jgi:hypothetical protein